eukprot:4493027-Amphidinium_carterae.1
MEERLLYVREPCNQALLAICGTNPLLLPCWSEFHGATGKVFDMANDGHAGFGWGGQQSVPQWDLGLYRDMLGQDGSFWAVL